jgi:GR25 family glycosyltransferase involved in LPS biosynthesis
MDSVDGIVYINLAKRADRRAHMEALCLAYGIQAIRFEAIEHSHGLYGCGLSHLAVLKIAKKQEWNRVLILEDDILIQEEPAKFKEAVAAIITRKFDVCMLDTNLQQSEKLDVDWLLKVKHSYCAGAYIVENHYYQKLIDLYEWALPKLLETGAHWLYANDAAWITLQQNDNWITFRPQLCAQMAGYSDTKNMVVG